MYELADGTKSTDYKLGDRFVVVKEHYLFKIGDVITLSKDDGTECPFFDGGAYGGEEIATHWCFLKAYKPQFTKADLKDGMVVTYREGEPRVVFRDVLYPTRETGLYLGVFLEYFTDDLKYDKNTDMDIMKVEYMGEVLWEREEEEETPEQKEIKRLQGIIKEAQDALNVINSSNNGECDE